MNLIIQYGLLGLVLGLGFILYQSINHSINQSMALSASCAGHTRTQSHAALYKIVNEVVVGWWHQITNVGLSECEVMDDTCYV